MHIITKRRLREFWAEYPNAEKPLRIWHQICERSEFGSFAELRSTFNSVDKVGKFTVFDIGGNKWRLITVVHYSTGKIYIRDVLTHEQYDQDDWKSEGWRRKQKRRRRVDQGLARHQGEAAGVRADSQ